MLILASLILLLIVACVDELDFGFNETDEDEGDPLSDDFEAI